MSSLLSIFNSKPVMVLAQKWDIGTYYVAHYAAITAGILTALLLLAIFRKRLPGIVKGLILSCVVIALMRLAFLDNPWILKYYSNKIDQDVLGRPAYRGLEYKIDGYFRELEPRKTQFMALGSSQARSIFGRSRRFKLLALPMVSSAHFMMYFDYIMSQRPQNLILYLSELDLGRRFDFEEVRQSIAPDSRYVMKVYLKGVETGMWNFEISTYMKVVLSALLPEYKYSHLIQTLFKEMLGYPFVFKRSFREWLIWQHKGFAQLDQSAFPFHFYFLEEFLKATSGKGIKITLVEGQFHPSEITQKTKEMNREARARFRDMAKRYEHVNFTPIEKLYFFRRSDFADKTHVRRNAAHNFLKNLSASF